MEILYSDLSKETGREEKGKSRDLSKGVSRQTGRQESGQPTQGSLERERREERSEQHVSEDRRGDRERRTYRGISSKRERGSEEKCKSRDLSNRSLKTGGETESGQPT